MSIRVHLISDLHLEFGRWADRDAAFLDAGADVVLVAGDTHRCQYAAERLVDIIPTHLPVAFVAGNHEHYDTGLSVEAGNAMLRREATRLSAGRQAPIIFLQDDEVVLTVRGIGVRILGATLWTDMALYGNAARDAAVVARSLNDYAYIKGQDGRRLTTDEVRLMHARSRAFLHGALGTSFDGPTIVMTHHLPTERAINSRYAGDILNAGFASPCDDLIALGAALWVFGHTHSSFEARDAGGTLLACNPSGYPRTNGRENQDYIPSLVYNLDTIAGGWRAENAT